ncbi:MULTISPECIES: AMP-binding protein [Acidiplasma]|uniref:AMP-dependent synthetase/ligase domain-containing protein n=2 Tax=Acidiplasma cupricumulans TaxID=312540 RepID=A0A0N8VLC4_9ARCH|nr:MULTISPECIES: AMP-binding protein [Acidiplasma]KJE48947.1 hypothetical protein TZ01_06670 [Acidiplasma sp. MBA-1]KQB36132.1 hypothetical protein AOG55_04860 [Acidiplasma cupricumulans]WMT54365.1 MAG: AMP-binding protein [Acidiplasma sp.]
MLNFLKGPLKVPEISICELFERNAGVNKSQPFMIFRGKFITYFKFSKYINSMAYELKAHGAYQNIVAVAIENPPEFLISVLAAMKAGNSVMIFNEDNLNNEELFYSTVNKMNIKTVIICSKYIKKIKIHDDLTYIVSDAGYFLTTGKSLINSLKSRNRIKYVKNILSLGDFIYSDNSINEYANNPNVKVIFTDGENIFAFDDNDITSETIIINYWMPKIDRRPYFYSTMPVNTPLGFLYGIMIPLSFSGTSLYGDLKLLKKIDVDFLILDGIDPINNMGMASYLDDIRYFISPNYDEKLYEKILKEFKKGLISGYSSNLLLTTHLNPFTDIRPGSMGMILNNINYKIDDDHIMYINSPMAAGIFNGKEFIKHEWYSTYRMVKIIDDYFYPL